MASSGHLLNHSMTSTQVGDQKEVRTILTPNRKAIYLSPNSHVSLVRDTTPYALPHKMGEKCQPIRPVEAINFLANEMKQSPTSVSDVQGRIFTVSNPVSDIRASLSLVGLPSSDITLFWRLFCFVARTTRLASPEITPHTIPAGASLFARCADHLVHLPLFAAPEALGGLALLTLLLPARQAVCLAHPEYRAQVFTPLMKERGEEDKNTPWDGIIAARMATTPLASALDLLRHCKRAFRLYREKFSRISEKELANEKDLQYIPQCETRAVPVVCGSFMIFAIVPASLPSKLPVFSSTFPHRSFEEDLVSDVVSSRGENSTYTDPAASLIPALEATIGLIVKQIQYLALNAIRHVAENTKTNWTPWKPSRSRRHHLHKLLTPNGATTKGTILPCEVVHAKELLHTTPSATLSALDLAYGYPDENGWYPPLALDEEMKVALSFESFTGTAANSCLFPPISSENSMSATSLSDHNTSHLSANSSQLQGTNVASSAASSATFSAFSAAYTTTEAHPRRESGHEIGELQEPISSSSSLSNASALSDPSSFWSFGSIYSPISKKMETRTKKALHPVVDTWAQKSSCLSSKSMTMARGIDHGRTAVNTIGDGNDSADGANPSQSFNLSFSNALHTSFPMLQEEDKESDKDATPMNDDEGNGNVAMNIPDYREEKETASRSMIVESVSQTSFTTSSTGAITLHYETMSPWRPSKTTSMKSNSTFRGQPLQHPPASSLPFWTAPEATQDAVYAPGNIHVSASGVRPSWVSAMDSWTLTATNSAFSSFSSPSYSAQSLFFSNVRSTTPAYNHTQAGEVLVSATSTSASTPASTSASSYSSMNQSSLASFNRQYRHHVQEHLEKYSHPQVPVHAPSRANQVGIDLASLRVTETPSSSPSRSPLDSPSSMYSSTSSSPPRGISSENSMLSGNRHLPSSDQTLSQSCFQNQRDLSRHRICTVCQQTFTTLTTKTTRMCPSKEKKKIHPEVFLVAPPSTTPRSFSFPLTKSLTLDKAPLLVDLSDALLGVYNTKNTITDHHSNTKPTKVSLGPTPAEALLRSVFVATVSTVEDVFALLSEFSGLSLDVLKSKVESKIPFHDDECCSIQCDAKNQARYRLFAEQVATASVASKQGLYTLLISPVGTYYNAMLLAQDMQNSDEDSAQKRAEEMLLNHLPWVASALQINEKVAIVDIY